MDMKHLLDQTEKVARGAGELISKTEFTEVSTKAGRANFVTNMDVASQQYIIAHLKDLLPEANFFAEESSENRMTEGYNWVIDPIDGTMNYLMGFKHSCISIGLVKDGEPVLGVVCNPYLDETYTAAKGMGAFLNGKRISVCSHPTENAIVLMGTSAYYREYSDLLFRMSHEIYDNCGDLRRTGSAALDMCYVASGKCDAYYEMFIQPWDFTAGTVIAREAGAVVWGMPEKTIDFSKPTGIIAGSEALCRMIMDIRDKHAAAIAESKH